MSEKAIFARTHRDDGIVEVLPDGRERPFSTAETRPMTEAEATAAAASDPAARPMTPDELRKARRVPRSRTLRRALGLTQAEFSARFHIPLDMVQGWEQGTAEPDPAALAYLQAIAAGACNLRWMPPELIKLV